MNTLERIRNGDCDEVDLIDFITDNDVNIAIAAAESVYATAPILDIAVHDKDRRVRLAALSNPNISNKSIMFLLNDSDYEIVQKAAEKLKG